ncbi:MAG: hypothetical protein HQ581_01340 [Planctomycetes bacterium]|nr:hypothetical protein [Planctomycetota bacterium]
MAVDLYCYIERQEENSWLFVGEMIPNEEHKYDPDAPKLAPSHILHSVHKELASILVDTGWAIRATEPYTAIVPRRGKPRDLSHELAAHFRYVDDDEATVYSWFTTRELNAFDLSSRVMMRQAYVPEEAAHLFANCPFGFPFDRWPPETPIGIAGWSRDGIEVRWQETYADIVKDFAELVPEVMKECGPPDTTRLVVQANW